LDFIFLLNKVLNSFRTKSFKIKDKNEVELNLIKKGPCDIFASDFVLPEYVEIINPNYFITTIDSHGDLAIDIKVKKDIGYFFL